MRAPCPPCDPPRMVTSYPQVYVISYLDAMRRHIWFAVDTNCNGFMSSDHTKLVQCIAKVALRAAATTGA